MTRAFFESITLMMTQEKITIFFFSSGLHI